MFFDVQLEQLLEVNTRIAFFKQLHPRGVVLPLLAALHRCCLSGPVVVRRPWFPEGALVYRPVLAGGSLSSLVSIEAAAAIT